MSGTDSVGQKQKGDIMRKLLMATALAGVMSSPAWAANVALTVWTDGTDAETATGTGQAALVGSSLDGVTITVSSAKRTTGPNDLTTANISIDNTTGSIQTLNISSGANNFLGPDSKYKLTGTIGVETGTADLVGSYFVDAANTLNGQGMGALVGTNVGGFDSGSLGSTDSFSFNGTGFFSSGSLYSFGEHMTLTLAPGASVFVQGVSMEASAVPEPGTWVMMGGGFALLAALGLRKRRVPRFAV